MREETEFIHVSLDQEFYTTANMHRYYRYLNSLSKMTVLPKGGNQMNVLGESRVFLLLLAPNSLACINVFDMIWEEILRASWSPLKGCLLAPFIMKMIEVVTQTHFEKPVKHSRYVPYWVDSSNPATRTKRTPLGSGGPASSLSHLLSLLIIHPPLASPLPHVRWTTAGEEVVRARDGVVVEDYSFIWPRAFLAPLPCAATGRSRSLCADVGLTGYMRIFFVMPPRQVILCLPGPLHLRPPPSLWTLMSGTNRNLVCHSLPLRMRPRSLMTPIIPRLILILLLPIRVRDPFPVTPGHPAPVTILLLPTRVRDPFLVTHGLLAPVITTLLLLISVCLLHPFFLQVMSLLGTPHSRKT
jgi:hypothetical protein